MATAIALVLGERFEREYTIRLREYGSLQVADWSEVLAAHEIFCAEQYRLQSPARPGVIVDLGSHAGFASVYFATKYPDAAIYAFEANPAVYARGVKNTSRFENVQMKNVAVTGDGKPLTLRRRRGASWAASAFAAKGDPFRAESTTLDAILTETGRVDLLKIDIEGSEFDVLESCTKLAAVAAIIGEVHKTHAHPCVDLRTILRDFAFVVEPTATAKCEFLATRAGAA